MSKVLCCILASPQERGVSFSRKRADAFISAYRESHPGDTVDTLHVWDEELPEFGPLSVAWKMNTMSGQPHSEAELVAVGGVNRAILGKALSEAMTAAAAF